MPRRRDPELVTQYLCFLCMERIKWGVLFRIMRTDPDQPDYMGREMYSHMACLRGILRPEVPLTLERHWHYKQPVPDDSQQIDGKPCGICAEAISPDQLTRLRIQHFSGTSRVPEFDEESVPVHTGCLQAKSAVSR